MQILDRPTAQKHILVTSKTHKWFIIFRLKTVNNVFFVWFIVEIQKGIIIETR